jgi:hypothetical protein
MPDLIVKKVNESVDMKIKLAIAETEKKVYGEVYCPAYRFNR